MGVSTSEPTSFAVSLSISPPKSFPTSPTDSATYAASRASGLPSSCTSAAPSVGLSGMTSGLSEVPGSPARSRPTSEPRPTSAGFTLALASLFPPAPPAAEPPLLALSLVQPPLPLLPALSLALPSLPPAARPSAQLHASTGASCVRPQPVADTSAKSNPKAARRSGTRLGPLEQAGLLLSAGKTVAARPISRISIDSCFSPISRYWTSTIPIA